MARLVITTLQVIKYLSCCVLDVGRLPPPMLKITNGNVSFFSLMAAPKHPAGFSVGATFLGAVPKRKYLAKNFISTKYYKHVLRVNI